MSATDTEKNKTRMRRFKIYRNTDLSGVSGTGLVAEGCEMSNGRVFMQWLTPFQSISFFDSIKALEIVHGHEGATGIHWIDS